MIPSAPSPTGPDVAQARVAGPRRDTVAVGIGIALLALLAATALVLEPSGHHHHDISLTGVVTYQGMWLVMVVAMMFPSCSGMVLALSRVSRGPRDGARLLGAAAVTYLAVWLAAGLFAWAASSTITTWLAMSAPVLPAADMAGMAMPAPDPHLAEIIAAVVLLAAGLLQLSPLTSRCLRACRSPGGFLARHWTGRPDRVRQAARIGLSYGRSCLGCCAALMAVPVLVGMDHLALMAGVGAVMAVQKHSRHGRTVARLAGTTMLIAAVAVLGVSLSS